MTPAELAAIRARAYAAAEADALRCVHGREPLDRCEVCSGEDSVTLLHEVERLREALSDLVSKFDAMKPGLNSAITIAAVHGFPYTGPNISDELKAAREALGNGAPVADVAPGTTNGTKDGAR